MKFVVETKHTIAPEPDLYVVFITDRDSVESRIQKRIDEIITAEQFEDKVGNTILIRTDRRRFLVVALGKLEELTMFSWQIALATVGRKAKEVRAKKVAMVFPIPRLVKNTMMSPRQLVQGAVEGLTLGTYDFLRHKHIDEQRKERKIETVIFYIDKKFTEDVKKGITFGQSCSKGTVLARDLVNEPSSVTTPSFLASYANSIGRSDPRITCEVLERRNIEKLGMGGIIGIAKGSDEDPKLITLTYKGHGKRTVVLVGKGVTFDSGGLSLKSQEGMEMMKIDMAGAATILGIFSVISEISPSVNVIGIIPAVENMPSGRAIKPGDIVRAHNGKTIEVVSTDAEGRVILADALSWAGKMYKPDVMIDLATLTGACMIALGEDIAGLFSTNDELTRSLKQAADRCGESVWELPLQETYNELLKSDIADIRNVTRKRYGGAITAALFLKAFVPDSVAWAHIDIAGPAIAEKDTPLMPVGGTGFGVRMILQYLSSPA